MQLDADEIGRVFEALIGLPARPADIETAELLGGSAEALAEFVWDHWMGGPASPSLDEVREAARLLAGKLRDGASTDAAVDATLEAMEGS